MKITVIGAGVMGAGIAQTFAAAGHEVVLADLTEEFAKKGFSNVEKQLSRQVAKGKLPEQEMSAILSRLTVTDVDGVPADPAYVIEAVFEDVAAKKELYAKLDARCAKETIFCTNTSSISISALAEGLSHPLVGMHFFNPVPVMPLVEVISGATTPENAKERVTELARAIGKTPVEVKDAPGFVVNRILIPMINEAVGIFAAGTASAEDIDQAMKLGANHPIGPLALGDLIGLDVVLAIMRVLERDTGDAKYRPHPLLVEMTEERRLGRKTGRGFYEYER